MFQRVAASLIYAWTRKGRFRLYLQGFIVADGWKWVVVQQGINGTSRRARRPRQLMDEERGRSHEYGGRCVFGQEPPARSGDSAAANRDFVDSGRLATRAKLSGNRRGVAMEPPHRLLRYRLAEPDRGGSACPPHCRMKPYS